MYENEIREIETEMFIIVRGLQKDMNILNGRIQDLKNKIEASENEENKKKVKKGMN